MPFDGLSVELYVPSPSSARARLDVAFQIPSGVSVLSGPSGSGKSTCLAALAGLVRPARGRIVLRGRTLLDTFQQIDVAIHARRVALVFQSLALFPHLSVSENVAFGLSPRLRDKAQRNALVAQWLERMQVAHLATRRTQTLSGGEAQRVALARALASCPSLLLLDEPFSALDEALRHELSREVSCLVTDLNIPALLVSHQRDDALAFGARTLELRNGLLVGERLPARARQTCRGLPRTVAGS